MSGITVLHVITNRWKHFLRKPCSQLHSSLMINVFLTAVLQDTVFPTLLFYLFTHIGIGGKKHSRNYMAGLQFGLSSNAALQLGQDDFFRHNG